MMLTDTGEVVGGVAIDAIVASLLELSTSVLTFITGNPLMMTLFGGSLVGVACYVLKKVKRTAKA